MVLGIRNCPVARLHILNRCGATVTDGWCPTAALRTGAATVRPVCCFGLRGGRHPRGAAAAPRAVEPSGRHLGLAGRCSRQPRDAGTDRGPRIERGGGPVRRATRGAGHGGHRRGVRGRRHALDLHHRCRRCRELLDTVPNRESAELRWVAENEVADLPLHPGFAASWQRLRTAPATVPLARCDERRQRLPRTIQIEAGVFLWCTPGDADQAPSPLGRRISSLL